MKINILILGMFLTVNAYATICEFDGNDKCYVPQSFLFKQDPLILQEAIKDFRNLSDYPSLGNGPIDKKNCQLPEENSKLEEVFNQLESHFSKGRSAFKIMTCDSHRKVSFSSYDKTVYFSDELLKKIGKRNTKPPYHATF